LEAIQPISSLENSSPDSVMRKNRGSETEVKTSVLPWGQYPLLPTTTTSKVATKAQVPLSIVAKIIGELTVTSDHPGVVGHPKIRKPEDGPKDYSKHGTTKDANQQNYSQKGLIWGQCPRWNSDYRILEKEWTSLRPRLVTIRGERHCGTKLARTLITRNARGLLTLSDVDGLKGGGVYGWKHGFLPQI